MLEDLVIEPEYIFGGPFLLNKLAIVLQELQVHFLMASDEFDEGVEVIVQNLLHLLEGHISEHSFITVLL